MAEAFGIVAGALSVAALFNNCVDTFAIIQLGRHFAQDYEACQLKLDIAGIRLGRWGQAVKINDDPRFDSGSPTDKSVQLTQSILEEIALLFESARKTSKRYELTKDQQNLGLLNDESLRPVGRALHKRLKDIIRQRQNQTSLVKKTTWALYDGKALENIISKIAEFVDALEDVFPVEDVRRKLAEMEIDEMDEQSLTVLKDAARGIDTVLSDAAGEKIDAVAGRNSAQEVNIEDTAKVQIGNVFSIAALEREIRVQDQTANSVGRVTAKGQSGAQVGNTFGGKGLWD